MPCYNYEDGSHPPATYDDMIKFLLCRACKKLSRDELNAIVWLDDSIYNNNDKISDHYFPDKCPKEITLLEWYKGHCSREMNQMELERLDGKPEPAPKKSYPY